ncbi:MAG: hypothetical protein ACRCV6_00750 [Formosimonas sp.]
MKMLKISIVVAVLLSVAGCSTVSRSVRTHMPSKLTCEEIREELKNINDLDREASKRGTRGLAYGQIDSRQEDLKKAAREKKCKI